MHQLYRVSLRKNLETRNPSIATASNSFFSSLCLLEISIPIVENIRVRWELLSRAISYKTRVSDVDEVSANSLYLDTQN